MYRYGIYQDDIFRAVNDTATAAVATGMLICDGRRPVGGTTCQMHAVELVLKHAFGLVERRSGGEVTDSFVQGKELRDRCKALASKVMDKKAKARFAEYEALSMETWSVKPIKLKTPNKTRVSGDYILIVSMLRAKSLLQVLVGQSKHTQAYKDCILGSDDWKLIAEFQAVMSHIHHLAMTSQGNEPGEIAFSWFELSMCWLTYKSRDKKKYNVVDCTQSWSPNTLLEELPTIKKSYLDLTTVAQEFVNRLDIEFGKYFPGPDSDQLVAMHLHPVVQRNTFE